jgi:hypothetical protein
MTDINVVRNAQIFLSRVDLKGHEVPAFAEVANWLASVAQPAVAPPLQEPDDESDSA